MRQPIFVSPIGPLLFCAALIAPSFSIASDVVLQKAPPLTVEQALACPENLARYHFDAEMKTLQRHNAAAKLELNSHGEDSNTSEAALLCDDPTNDYELPAGRSSLFRSPTLKTSRVSRF